MMMLPNKIFSLLLQFFTLLYLVTITFASTEEATALLKWKSTFKNQNNSLLASWQPSSDSCNDWYGVSCINGKVNTLNITNASVFGTLYAFPFSSLPFLEYLNLSMNNLSGTIPPEIGNLKNLNNLTLSNNQLTGSIPSSFGNLRNLQTLFLDRNNLIEEIPSSICNLTSLKVLYLSRNTLKGKFPQCLGNITGLQYVMMSHNNLSGELPPSICNLTSLQSLDLCRNNLMGAIPQCFGNMSDHLEVLDMKNNNLSGTLPTTFSIGSALRSLNLHGNKLEGKIPRSLENCQRLEVVDLGDNLLNDTFPMWLGTLPELRVLSLKSNKLHGPITTSGSEYMFLELRIFDLSRNDFSKNLPTSLFQHLKAMRTTDQTSKEPRYLGDSYYHDSVMVSTKGLELQLLRILTIYTTIDLSNNKFEGYIPSILGDLIVLRVLNLSHNGLQGHIPPTLGDLSVVESLDLSGNQLEGEIPAQFASLTFLEVLNLSYNHLEGCIPQGNQLHTFENNSYEGNDGLRGFPLSKGCGNDGHDSASEETNARSALDEESNSEFLNDFWKAALMGYGTGLCIGLSIIYILISTGNMKWLERIVQELGHKIMMRRRKKQRRQRNYRRRNNRF
ncbi:hypothetical protein T459_31575 [Capsicum annuum]|uniref:Uncharacterized protein n=1 Tax=Capsicum annuum TaxID=4072 RepID=A0A2G2YBP6_CAPAN|nr:hypothetical protein T459_31575 [Capsicum annuum]